ncbi:MAG: AAA family ATPase, partial [bacterium]
MNIQEAKNEVKNTVEVYLEKDEFGEYLIPSEKQRPVFLMGSAGIGKTAIIEQIGAELDLPVVCYNMTHHTRQSSIGLPYIEVKEFNGVSQRTSEYTMSEIVGNIYNMIEKTGKKEGILFLDEINCVSETLAPIMLQFLQYKVFGNHPIPKGYVV